MAKLEQLHESILKKERHLAQLEQDTTEVREKNYNRRFHPLGLLL